MWANSYSSDSEQLTDQEKQISDDEKGSADRVADAAAAKDNQPFVGEKQSDKESESDAMYGSPTIIKSKVDRISLDCLNKDRAGKVGDKLIGKLSQQSVEETQGRILVMGMT